MREVKGIIEIIDIVYENDEKTQWLVKNSLLRELELVDSYAKERLITEINQDKSNPELMSARKELLSIVQDLKSISKPKKIERLENNTLQNEQLERLKLYEDWSGRNIRGYSLDGDIFKANTYRDMFKGIVKILYDMHKQTILDIADTSRVMGSTETYISKYATGVKNPIIIGEDLYIEKVTSTQMMSNCIKELLIDCGYTDWDFCIFVK